MTASVVPMLREEPQEQIGARIWSHPLVKQILERFGPKVFARCSATNEFIPFLERIRGKERGGTCLEIGTYQGITAILLAQYFDRVISISIDEDLTIIKKHEIVRELRIDNVTFIDAADNEDKARRIGRLDFDFCYSDGDHAQDTLTDWNLVQRCGQVLFHEHWPLQPAVWDLVNSLPRDEVMWTEHDCMAFWRRKRA